MKLFTKTLVMFLIVVMFLTVMLFPTVVNGAEIVVSLPDDNIYKNEIYVAKNENAFYYVLCK